MLALLKRKARSAAVMLAAVVIGLQTLVPTFVDLLLGIFLVAAVLVMSKTGN